MGGIHSDPKTALKPAESTTITSQQKEISSSKKSNTQELISPKLEAQPEKVTEKVERVIYKIQFLSLSTNKKLSGGNYEILDNISSYLHHGMYRYTSELTYEYDEAIKLQSKVRKAGFKDAFLVAFYKDKRISLKEARDLNKQ